MVVILCKTYLQLLHRIIRVSEMQCAIVCSMRIIDLLLNLHSKQPIGNRVESVNRSDFQDYCIHYCSVFKPSICFPDIFIENYLKLSLAALIFLIELIQVVENNSSIRDFFQFSHARRKAKNCCKWCIWTRINSWW